MVRRSPCRGGPGWPARDHLRGPPAHLWGRVRRGQPIGQHAAAARCHDGAARRPAVARRSGVRVELLGRAQDRRRARPDQYPAQAARLRVHPEGQPGQGGDCERAAGRRRRRGTRPGAGSHPRGRRRPTGGRSARLCRAGRSREPRARAGPDDEGRRRLLAVHVRHHGDPQGGRSLAPRYARLLRSVRPKAIYERWLEKFGLEILDGIGSTEMCHTFIANRRGKVRPGSSGTIVPGYEAKLVDDAGRDVAVGEVGNLMVKGDSACACYWNQHERTKQTIEGEWVRTGDKYTCDADGYFWYAGRTDDMIKAGGMWVSPAEVEGALAEHPAVVEAGVVGAEDKDGLVKPLAFVVLARGHAESSALEAELKAFVKQRLAPYKYPRWIVFAAELPKTATGKIQRFKLRDIAKRTDKTRHT